MIPLNYRINIITVNCHGGGGGGGGILFTEVLNCRYDHIAGAIYLLTTLFNVRYFQDMWTGGYILQEEGH